MKGAPEVVKELLGKQRGEADWGDVLAYLGAHLTTVV